MLTGEIELVGPDQRTDFIGCLDNRWLGSYSGPEHGNRGHGRIRLAAIPLGAANGRIEPGRHELALIISGAIGPNTLYFTEPPAFINIVEPESRRTLDSRTVAGRRATVRGGEALGWLFRVDEMGRIVAWTETMLAENEVLSRHCRCVYGSFCID